MEESIEIVLEKLLHVTKDMVAKVFLPFFFSLLESFDLFSVLFCVNLMFFVAMQISDEANRCINVLLSKYDHFRCLSVCTNLFSYISVLILFLLGVSV
jgi:CLIP-associating protein 1/2